MCTGHDRKYALAYTRFLNTIVKRTIAEQYSVERCYQNADRICQANRSLQCRALRQFWLSGNHKIVGICDPITNDDL